MFIRQARILSGSFIAAFLFFSATASFAITLPKPMAIDIDDLGWKEGWDLDESGGPWRLGLPRGRMMGLQDYEVINYISQAVGVRIKCLFIMSEFDRSNICANYPTTNEHGSDWDNSRLVNDEDFLIMDYVKENAAHIEFGLHGVRHEFWDADTREPSRAEWADSQKKRPWDILWGHMECFRRDFRSSETSACLGIEMYGTQQVKVKLRFTPQEVTSSERSLEILDWRYDAPFLTMSVRGRNIQGESGKIAIKSKEHGDLLFIHE